MTTRPDLFPDESLKKSEFLLAYAQVHTRAFGGDSFPSSQLIPFADMLNHSHLNIAHYAIHPTMHSQAVAGQLDLSKSKSDDQIDSNKINYATKTKMANDYSTLSRTFQKPDQLLEIEPWTHFDESNGTDSEQNNQSDADFDDIDLELPVEEIAAQL